MVTDVPRLCAFYSRRLSLSAERSIRPENCCCRWYLSRPDDHTGPTLHSSSRVFAIDGDGVELKHWVMLAMCGRGNPRVTLTLSTGSKHIGVAFMDLDQFNVISEVFRPAEIELRNEAGVVATLEVHSAAFTRNADLLTSEERQGSSTGSLVPLEDPQAASIISGFQENRASALGSAFDFLGALEVGGVGSGEESFAPHGEGFEMLDELLDAEEDSESSSQLSILEDTENLGCAQDVAAAEPWIEFGDSPEVEVTHRDHGKDTRAFAELEDSPTAKQEVLKEVPVDDDDEKKSFAVRTARLKDLVVTRRQTTAAVQVNLSLPCSEPAEPRIPQFAELLPLRRELLRQREALEPTGGRRPCKFNNVIRDTIDLALEVTQLRDARLADDFGVADDEQQRAVEELLRTFSPEEAQPATVPRPAVRRETRMGRGCKILERLQQSEKGSSKEVGYRGSTYASSSRSRQKAKTMRDRTLELTKWLETHGHMARRATRT
ncbi:hypothetical protein FOZ62_005713 [Perkinsus olseni]|uniref:Uncharacterized protein n=1 Tax=Perkinsus olseni TaxID=32597 RepID=A0A7J6RVS5_PEROL|nr:hypothetical protein FOZ62_005713 [Perkinsus olseni]